MHRQSCTNWHLALVEPIYYHQFWSTLLFFLLFYVELCLNIFSFSLCVCLVSFYVSVVIIIHLGSFYFHFLIKTRHFKFVWRLCGSLFISFHYSLWNCETAPSQQPKDSIFKFIGNPKVDDKSFWINMNTGNQCFVYWA